MGQKGIILLKHHACAGAPTLSHQCHLLGSFHCSSGVLQHAAIPAFKPTSFPQCDSIHDTQSIPERTLPMLYTSTWSRPFFSGTLGLHSKTRVAFLNQLQGSILFAFRNKTCQIQRLPPV